MRRKGFARPLGYSAPSNLDALISAEADGQHFGHGELFKVSELPAIDQSAFNVS
jgi:hypothetical protein